MALFITEFVILQTLPNREDFVSRCHPADMKVIPATEEVTTQTEEDITEVMEVLRASVKTLTAERDSAKNELERVRIEAQARAKNQVNIEVPSKVNF